MIQMEFYGHIYGFMFVTRVHCGCARRHASRLSHTKRSWTVELKELSFFLNFIILHALFNAPTCVDSENLCMGTPALLKKVRTPSKK